MTTMFKGQPGAVRHVRVPLGPEPWREAESFRLVHVGQSAVILARPTERRGDHRSELVAITSRLRGLVPGGVCLPDHAEFAEFAHQVSGDEPVRPAQSPRTVSLDAWLADPPQVIERVDLRLPPTALDPLAVARMGSSLAAQPVQATDPVMDPRAQRELAGPLARAALAGDDLLAEDLLVRLIGAGPGTTPAGDDVVIGVLATLTAATGLPRAHGLDPARRLAAPVAALVDQTTAMSRHDLLAAIDGQFSEHVHVLVRALADPTLVAAAIAHARTWGASSGIDHASGATAAARAVLTLTSDQFPSRTIHPRRSA
ncbi:DUF2877 domain-containing protein [Cellulomonas cellasea]|uniref:oxamate carbamoyltransferase subunit AllH family protein n=1 Tax=Cellulomonas cellasea TaxID=43670 RepID=UPI0025A4826E|nr:DUF2877 domain-containing protein [Cellulomonas cellasea]MDM8084553.1 DUF2877 domain-containing protein [Cellulomonas cellasea]